MTRFAAAAITLVLLAALPPGRLAHAEEQVAAFDARIAIAADGSLAITETIVVEAAGAQMLHGVYRDFPDAAAAGGGRPRYTPLEIREVTRNGRPETYRVARLASGPRLYLGAGDRLLPQGTHTFVLTYRAERRLDRVDGRDRLSWNVTGNGWTMPIARASATIRLPEAVSRDAIEVRATTGLTGARGKPLESRIDESGSVRVETTRPLGPWEALTVELSWPAGFIADPPLASRLTFAFADRPVAGAGLLVLALVSLYYVAAWMICGRGPRPGSIAARPAPPDGISPAAARYLDRLGCDVGCLAAAVLELAVGRVLAFEESNGTITLSREDGLAPARVADDARGVAELLLGDRGSLAVDAAHHEVFAGAMRALSRRLRSTHLGPHVEVHRRVAGFGLLLSAVGLLALGLVMVRQGQTAGLLALLGVSGWSAGLVYLGRQAWPILQAAVAGRSVWRSSGEAVGRTLPFAAFLVGEVVGVVMLARSISGVALAVIGTLVVLNVVFWIALRRPTREGRRLLDELEGYRLHLAGPTGPADPSTFEAHLPYAVALGLGRPWLARFEAGLDGHDWYRPAPGETAGAEGFSARLRMALALAITAGPSDREPADHLAGAN